MSGHLWSHARDLWPLKTPMRIGEWHETARLASNKANFYLFLTSELGRKFSSGQILKWEKNVAPDVFCKLETFAIHRKTFLVTSQTFLKRWCLFPLRSSEFCFYKHWKRADIMKFLRMKKSKNYDIFEDDKEWYYCEDSEIKEVDKYGSLGSSVTCRL